jgi:hypothetical protein
MLQNFKNKITNIKENKAFNNININLLNGNLKKKLGMNTNILFIISHLLKIVLIVFIFIINRILNR